MKKCALSSVESVWKVVFQLPESALYMLTAAFGGFDKTKKAYHVALKENYRFGPFGDVLLIID